MGNSKIEAAALFVALAAGAFILGILRPYGWLTGIGGLVLLFVLFAYDQEGYRSIFQSVAFGSVCGFALMLLVAAYIQARAVGSAIDHAYAQDLPIAWACATIIFILLDRVRMAGRFHTAQTQDTLGIATARYATAQPRRTTPVPAPASATPAAPEPQPAPLQRAEAPAPVPEPVAAERIAAEPVSTPAPAPPAVPEHAVPVRHGKETSIYINLVDEGLAIMRPVRAEHMGKDFYLITEPMPANESWEFTTGQIVRCRKKNLSHGKGLVAVEEAPRAS